MMAVDETEQRIVCLESSNVFRPYSPRSLAAGKVSWHAGRLVECQDIAIEI